MSMAETTSRSTSINAGGGGERGVIKVKHACGNKSTAAKIFLNNEAGSGVRCFGEMNCRKVRIGENFEEQLTNTSAIEYCLQGKSRQYVIYYKHRQLQ